jgi:hypothetical protein
MERSFAARFGTALSSVVICWTILTAVTPPIWASHATLTGERFESTSIEVHQLSCLQSQVLFKFTATGVAVGPYPGTFVENVTWDWNPPSGTPSFQATFTIDSVDSNGQPIRITGTKQGGIGGGCAGGNPAPFVTGGGLVMYTAQINGFTDQGMANVNFALLQFGAVGTFNETFTSTLQPAVVVLQPPSDTNPVGTTHTVTATAYRAGQPSSGVRIDFTVTGSVDKTGSCTTDQTGTCAFTYEGPQFPGADVIRACPTDPIPGSTCGTATKVWILPASTPGQVTGGGGILHGTTINGVTFGFNAQRTPNGTLHGQGNAIDHRANVRIKILTVETLVVVGTHATFFGDAEYEDANRMKTRVKYRVDVDDLGEGKNRVTVGPDPGAGVLLDTFKLQTDSGYVAAGPLTQGNIQIHK